MRAFNRRLEPKEIGGIPTVAAIALVAALVAGVLTLMLPWALKIFTALGVVGAIALVIAVFRLGDDFPFRWVMLAAKRERGCVTSETWSRY